MNKSATIFIILLLFSACSSKDMTTVYGTLSTKRISVEPYSKIMIGDGIPLTIKEGEQEDIVLRTFTSVFEHIETYVKDGVLHIRVDDNVEEFDRKPNISVSLTNKLITKLVANGQNHITTEGDVFDTDTLYLEIAHRSSFKGVFTANRTEVKLEYGSTIDIVHSDTDSLILNMLDESHFYGKFATTKALSTVMVKKSTASIAVSEKITKAELKNKCRLTYKSNEPHNHDDLNIDRDSKLEWVERF